MVESPQISPAREDAASMLKPLDTVEPPKRILDPGERADDRILPGPSVPALPKKTDTSTGGEIQGTRRAEPSTPATRPKLILPD